MNPKKQSIIERIKHHEECIRKGLDYLETGQHAHWSGFRPLLGDKVRDGKKRLPHKDWVRNVFVPRHEKGLIRAEDLLKALDKSSAEKSETLSRLQKNRRE